MIWGLDKNFDGWKLYFLHHAFILQFQIAAMRCYRYFYFFYHNSLYDA